MGSKMGIEHLWQVLDEKKCGQSIPLNRLKYVLQTDQCRLAIDAKLIFHKHFSTQWKIMIERSYFSYDKVYTEAVRKIKESCNLLTTNGIEQLWCMDGDRTADKLATSRRSSARESGLIEIAKLHKQCSDNITTGGEQMDTEANALLPYAFLKEYWQLCDSDSADAKEDDGSKGDSTSMSSDSVMSQIEALKRLLAKHMIIPKNYAEVMEARLKKEGCKFLQVSSISEGEKLCVVAVQTGYCQAVLTTDTDVLPLGVRFVVKEIKDGLARVYTYGQALRNLEMTHEQFLSLCVMLGNDFNDGVEGMAKVGCMKEVMREDFNLYDFDVSRCGCLRVNTCINSFSISAKEYEMVSKAIETS
jgi:hypothetical protein